MMVLARPPALNPVSDHFDGRRFFNPNGAAAGKSVLALLRWKTLGAGRAPWPKSLQDPPQPPPPESVADDEVAATFVGHATWLLRFAAGVVLTDPVWSDHAGPFGRFGPRRVRPPALPFARLPPVNAVLVSHSHYDHMDLPTLRRLDRAFRPRFVTTLGNERFLRKYGLRDVTELDWWQSATPCAGLTVTLTPAQHFVARTPFDRNRTLWGGFYLAAGPVSVYFGSDLSWISGSALRSPAYGLPSTTPLKVPSNVCTLPNCSCLPTNRDDFPAGSAVCGAAFNSTWNCGALMLSSSVSTGIGVAVW